MLWFGAGATLWLFPRGSSQDHPGQNLPIPNWTLCCTVLSKRVGHPGEVSPRSSDPSLRPLHPRSPSPPPGEEGPFDPLSQGSRPQRDCPLALQVKAGIQTECLGSNPRPTTIHEWATTPHPQGLSSGDQHPEVLLLVSSTLLLGQPLWDSGVTLQKLL